MGKFVGLTGQRFGRLTVRCRDTNRNEKKMGKRIGFVKEEIIQNDGMNSPTMERFNYLEKFGRVNE